LLVYLAEFCTVREERLQTLLFFLEERSQLGLGGKLPVANKTGRRKALLIGVNYFGTRAELLLG
jgi:hypothetical protein